MVMWTIVGVGAGVIAVGTGLYTWWQSTDTVALSPEGKTDHGAWASGYDNNSIIYHFGHSRAGYKWAVAGWGAYYDENEMQTKCRVRLDDAVNALLNKGGLVIKDGNTQSINPDALVILQRLQTDGLLNQMQAKQATDQLRRVVDSYPDTGEFSRKTLLEFLSTEEMYKIDPKRKGTTNTDGYPLVKKDDKGRYHLYAFGNPQLKEFVYDSKGQFLCTVEYEEKEGENLDEASKKEFPKSRSCKVTNANGQLIRSKNAIYETWNITTCVNLNIDPDPRLSAAPKPTPKGTEKPAKKEEDRRKKAAGRFGRKTTSVDVSKRLGEAGKRVADNGKGSKPLDPRYLNSGKANA